MQTPTVRTLTANLLPDFLAFFDGDAFADNPEWFGCYCVYYHVDHQDWLAGVKGSSPEARAVRAKQHRTRACDLVSTGGINGFLAYVDDRVVGWCNAGPREAYQNAREYAAARDDTPGVGAIMCFVVSEPYRRSGVALALLEAVCDSFAASGLRFAEAYPSLDPEGPSREAALYHGPVDLYLKAGFERVRDFDEFAVMRKRLA